MKALIAAGGKGTRLRPITYSINKHLFPIANKPMIFYALERLSEAGIKEVAINVNEGEKEIQEAVGDGSKWGLEVTYLEQKGGALGLSHVVLNAKEWLGDDDFIFYLGDNIISGSIKNLVERFQEDDLDCLLALSKVPDPERFGVPVFEGDKIKRVEEKPENPGSDLAVTGIYIYSSKIMEAVSGIEPSERGELEISDAHTYLIEHGAKVGYEEITGWWKDTGKPSDLLEGNCLVLDKMKESKIEGEVADSVEVEGKVKIRKGAKVSGSSKIEGPVIIGEGAQIVDSLLGPGTAIGADCEIRNSQIENSIVCAGSKILNCKQGVADSLIGRECLVGGGESKTSLIIGDRAEVKGG